jgi:ecotin
MTLTRLAMLFAFFASSALGSEHPQLEPFPEPAEDQTRFVIALPEMARGEDDNFSVELITGRTIRTDGINRYRMDTSLKPQPLEGWGYTFYEMAGTGQTSSTRMAVPEGTAEVMAFVGGTPLTIRFNSRLPIVVYVPSGFEVRYRIWAAAEEYLTVDPG